MTTAVNTIEVTLPEGVRASPQDVEMLSSLLRVIASLRFEEGREWPRLSRALELGGWRVSWGLQWHVEARRDRARQAARHVGGGPGAARAPRLSAGSGPT